jgi:uncharacterized protein (DUF2252 family)
MERFRRVTRRSELMWRDSDGVQRRLVASAQVMSALGEVAATRGVSRARLLRGIEAELGRRPTAADIDAWLRRQGIDPDTFEVPSWYRLTVNYRASGARSNRRVFVTRRMFEAMVAEAERDGVPFAEVCRRISFEGRHFGRRAWQRYFAPEARQ